ncbi:MAG: hypothetical protein PHD97_02145 [Bacteroidales bacterium]|nr:hypothetical protein [Bacteroidales bacterium]
MNKLISVTCTFGLSFFIFNSYTTAQFRSNSKGSTILQEDYNIKLVGKREFFINILLSKKIKVKILDSAGLKAFSKITLPEPFDQTYIYHNSEIRNSGFFISNFKVGNFDATIINENSLPKKANIKQETKKIISVGIDGYFGNLEQSIYNIDNIKIGDILEINYNILIPYNGNAENIVNIIFHYTGNIDKLTSFRLFFNSIFEKEKFDLKISVEKGMIANIFDFNNAKPDSIIDTDKEKIYKWHRNNLSGCINEEGSRPYLSLPYLLITIIPDELHYTIPNSFIERNMPLYVLAASYRERRFLPILQGINNGVVTKQFLGIYEFIDKETSDIKNDSTGLIKFTKLNSSIVDNFTYNNDKNYFLKEDVAQENLGEYTSNNTLRDISRYNLYVAILFKLGLGPYSAYLVDKRFGEISSDFVAPMFDSDFLLCPVTKTGRISFIYPKKSRFGYYVSELPFYFENVKTRLVWQDDYNYYKDSIKETFRYVITPTSSLLDNERKNNVMVNVDIDKKSTTFNGRIILKGQYSTLIRGVYLYNYKDQTINELYNKKIYDLNNYVKVNKNEVKIVERGFPFKSEINVQYSCDSLIKKNGDTCLLSLKKWFNHIIYKNIDTSNRQQSFYSDFLGIDTYVYMVNFNKNVEIYSMPSMINISNEYGDLIIEAEKIDSNNIKISSYFATKAEVVLPNKINLVKSIFNNIDKLNNSCIKFKTLN